MKNFSRVFWLLACMCVAMIHVYAGVNPKPFVIPELKEWKGGEGYFTPANPRIACPGGDPELLRIAGQFAADYKEMFGKELEVFSGRGKAGDFIFSYQNDKKLGKEGYTIRIADRVIVSAPQSQGVYWATRTLL